MDPRGRKELENSLKIHKKIHRNLNALNIINLKMTCNNILQKEYPGKYLSVTELERSNEHIKNCIDKYDLADRYKEPYACISTYSKSMEDVSIQLILYSEKKFDNLKKKFRNLENSKNLKCIDKLIMQMGKKNMFLLQQNLLHIAGYNIHNRETDCADNITLENELRKFLKVRSLLPPEIEILPNVKEGRHQFLSLVKLLHRCCEKNISDSKIIVDILSIVIKFKVPRNETFRFVPLPEPPKFFRYILEHIKNMGKQDILFQQEDSRNAWGYLRNFSIVDAVIWSDEQRVKDLIDYGIHVLPKDEQQYTKDELHDLSQVIPLEHKVILYLMKSIQEHQMWTQSDHGTTLTETQKKCFLAVMLELAAFYVTKSELNESLKIEYELKMSHNLPRDKCETEYRKKRRSVEMYATNFSQFDVAPKPKDVFKYFINLPYMNRKFESAESVLSTRCISFPTSLN